MDTQESRDRLKAALIDMARRKQRNVFINIGHMVVMNGNNPNPIQLTALINEAKMIDSTIETLIELL